jgi:hypothetical protein
MRIRILLTTDLLSEGVNLHNAEVVVHLDLPWTAARLEQRVGRLSRIGSPYELVHVFGFAPPRALEQAQRTVARLRAKWRAGRRRFGESALLLDEALVSAPRRDSKAAHAEAGEELQRVVAQWLGSAHGDSLPVGGRPVMAHVVCSDCAQPIALLLLRTPSGSRLAAIDGANGVSVHPRVVLSVARRLSYGDDARSARDEVSRIVQRARRYLSRRRGEESARSSAAGAVVAALQARVARVIARLPRSTRPAAMRQVAALRATISNARSAGDQAILAEKAARLLEMEAGDPMRWLQIASGDLTGSFADRAPMHDSTSNWGLEAILIGS